MYSKSIEPQINKMFSELATKSFNMIENSTSANIAINSISQMVASEITTRSKTMLSDMYADLSKQVLDNIPDISKQNRFYEANLRQEIFAKYSFDIPKEIDFKEVSNILTSLIAAAGTAGIGTILVHALSPSSPIIPVASIVVASIGMFCISYFAVTPKLNKINLKKAIQEYLIKIKKQYMNWFNDIENYFNKRAKEINAVV